MTPVTNGAFEQLGDQAGPAGLVRRADAAAGVAVEVLVEQDVVAEVRIGLQLRSWSPKTGRRPSRPSQEEPRQAARQFVGHLVDRA